MDNRLQKQVFIAFIFIIIFGAIGLGIYNSFQVKPTCFDNIQNEKEEGVDCGLLACGKTCEPSIMPITVSLIKLFRVANGDYDFIAQVSNPNFNYGAPEISYNLILLDQNNSEVSRQNGQFYILPGQTKYIVTISLKSPTDLSSAKLEIKSAKWEKIDLPDGGVTFALQAKDFKQGTNRSDLSGILFNNSNFDFDRVEVSAILFDDSGNVLGVNETDIRTFLSKSRRGFSVFWPFPINGQVTRTDIEASTNLFKNSNFIKSYGTQEKFQKFY